MSEKLNETAHRILDSAQVMVMTNGLNGFSYKDLQREVGIKTSSIHYHFPTKQDLITALMTRHNAIVESNLEEITRKNSSAKDRIREFGNSFVRIAEQDKFCLCGMLASDLQSTSPAVTNHVNYFFQIAEQWISEQLQSGIDSKEFERPINPAEAASCFIASMEGGVLIARAKKDVKYMELVLNQAMSIFK